MYHLVDRIYIYLIYWYLVRSLGQGFYNCLSFCSQGRVCIPACNGQGMCISACNGAGRCLPGVSTQGGVCLGGVCLSARGVSAQGVSAGGCLPPHPPTETATEAGSTQPTGIHSCSTYFMNFTQGDSGRLSLAVASYFSALVVLS